MGVRCGRRRRPVRERLMRLVLRTGRHPRPGTGRMAWRLRRLRRRLADRCRAAATATAARLSRTARPVLAGTWWTACPSRSALAVARTWGRSAPVRRRQLQQARPNVYMPVRNVDVGHATKKKKLSNWGEYPQPHQPPSTFTNVATGCTKKVRNLFY